MIEYFDNENILNIITYDKKFNPMATVRDKSLLDTSVIFNNYNIFSVLLDHDKFDISYIESNINKYEFVKRIFRRLGNSDIEENKRYYQKLIDIGYNISGGDLLHLSNKEAIFIDVFESVNKTKELFSILLQRIKNNNIIKFLLEHLLSNNYDFFTKKFIDETLLFKALCELNYELILLLKELNIDITSCYNPYSSQNTESLYVLLYNNVTKYENKIVYKIIPLISVDVYKRNLLDTDKYNLRTIIEIIINYTDQVKKYYPETKEVSESILGNYVSTSNFSNLNKLLNLDICKLNPFNNSSFKQILQKLSDENNRVGYYYFGMSYEIQIANKEAILKFIKKGFMPSESIYNNYLKNIFNCSSLESLVIESTKVNIEVPPKITKEKKKTIKL